MTLTGIVARYFDAWNDHDAAACASCFESDGVREWRVLAPPHIGGSPFPRFTGRATIAERIEEFMASVPDLEIDVSALSEGSDDRVWTEWRLRGTHAIDLGAWPARGEPVRLRRRLDLPDRRRRDRRGDGLLGHAAHVRLGDGGDGRLLSRCAAPGLPLGEPARQLGA